MIGATDVALAGRVSVVTGAASGIGRAPALGPANLGSDLVVCDRDASGLADLVERVRGLGRTVVEDVAGVVAFLVGPCSSFVTGAMIPVDGATAAAGGWYRDVGGSFLTSTSVHSGDGPET